MCGDRCGGVDYLCTHLTDVDGWCAKYVSRWQGWMSSHIKHGTHCMHFHFCGFSACVVSMLHTLPVLKAGQTKFSVATFFSSSSLLKISNFENKSNDVGLLGGNAAFGGEFERRMFELKSLVDPYECLCIMD